MTFASVVLRTYTRLFVILGNVFHILFTQTQNTACVEADTVSYLDDTNRESVQIYKT